MGSSHSDQSGGGGGFFSAIHNIAASMAEGNPMVQTIYGIKPQQPTSSSATPQPSSAPTPEQTSDFKNNVRMGPGVQMKRPAPSVPEEQPPTKIQYTTQRPSEEALDLSGPSSKQHFPESYEDEIKNSGVQDSKSSPSATYDDLKSMGAQDLFNIPESVASTQYKLSSLMNILPTDYTNSSEFTQFRDNLNFLSNRNLLSKHEMDTWMNTLKQSTDPIEDFIQPEETQQLQQKVSEDPSLLHQLSLHPQQLLQWMHEPLSPLSFAVMAFGTLEHNDWTPDRKQKALQAMISESKSNSIMKQGLQWVSQALQSTQGQINPSQRPSFRSSNPVNDSSGSSGGVHQKGDLFKGASNILEGYGSYKTGSGLGSYARKAEKYVQGESAVSEIIGIENAQKLAGGISRVAPVAEGLGEAGAVIAIAEGVNEVTTALGITKENYVGEGISWVSNKIEDAFQNVLSSVKHLFS